MEDNQGGISGMNIRSTAPLVDSEGDGLPDYWETQCGLNPHNPTDAATDLNGNEISNLLEYKLGMNPTDVTKATVLSAIANAVLGQVAVTFSKPIFYTSSSFVNDPRNATIATNPVNYSISPPLAIMGVSVKGNVVTLTTAQQTPSATPYTLTVNNVRDVNNWPVAANTQVDFFVSAPDAQPLRYKWTTIAGEAGVSGSDDGTNRAARFNTPWGVALDGGGNFFVADNGNNTIRKLTRDGPNWVSTTIAGLAGQSGSADGTNSAARFNFTNGNGYFAWDRAGNLFLTDNENGAIRKLTRDGTNWVTITIAGKGGWPGVQPRGNRSNCNIPPT
jgi:hypothetical protein